MFENVGEDLRLVLDWHNVPAVRTWLGPRAEQVVSILLSAELQTVLLYRFQARSRSKGAPIVPGFCRQLTMLLAGVSIGDRVTIGPGILINHGHVIIDGTTAVFIGTGAKVLEPITIGDNARIGANAVVLSDVPADSTAVGVPARVLSHERPFGRVVATERD